MGQLGDKLRNHLPPSSELTRRGLDPGLAPELRDEMTGEVPAINVNQWV